MVYSKFQDMEDVKEIQMAPPLSWRTTLASLLPLWLLTISIMVEGFPQPPIPIGLAVTSFVLAILVSIALLWKGWMKVELVLYSLLPFVFLFAFDEISTTYKSPFIVLCSLILTAGIVGYQRSRSAWLSWLIMLSASVATLVMASHAANSFWDMVADLGFEECFPDAEGCVSLTGQEIPWWVLFFSL